MSNISTPPSRNLSLDGTLTGLMAIFKDKILQDTDDMLPAQVVAYDRSINRVQVQPLIVIVTTAGTQINRGQIASLPVLQAGGGGFVVSFPLNTGDLGWIKANDRDITFFLKTYTESAPNTARKHTFSDAVFIPDSFMRNVTINREDNENLVIQTNDGAVRVAIWSNKVKITAPSVIIDTPTTTCTGNLIVDGNITVDGSSTLIGNVQAQGNLAVDVNLDVTGTATINGLGFAAHRHGGVQSGSSDTGIPV